MNEVTHPRKAKPTRTELVAAVEQMGTLKAVAEHYGVARMTVWRWMDGYGLKARIVLDDAA